MAIIADGKNQPVDEALHLARKALEINPHNDVTSTLVNRLEQLKRGEDFINMNRFDDAIKLYREMVNSNPKYPLVHYNLARVLLKKGLVKEAEDEFDKALELNPVYRMALVGYARLKFNKTDYLGAVELARRAYSVNPNNEETKKLLNELESSYKSSRKVLQ